MYPIYDSRTYSIVYKASSLAEAMVWATVPWLFFYE